LATPNLNPAFELAVAPSYPPSLLPYPPNAYFPRIAEEHALRSLLRCEDTQSHSQREFVVLLGVEGVGKTWLAREVLTSAFEDDDDNGVRGDLTDHPEDGEHGTEEKKITNAGSEDGDGRRRSRTHSKYHTLHLDLRIPGFTPGDLTGLYIVLSTQMEAFIGSLVDECACSDTNARTDELSEKDEEDGNSGCECGFELFEQEAKAFRVSFVLTTYFSLVHAVN
jgi:hypothetical protein